MAEDRKMLSVVIPVYYNEGNLEELYRRLKIVLNKLGTGLDHEIIFVNDGSQDNSWRDIEKFSAVDKNIKAIDFSRNFGQQSAITAGLQHSKGDAVIIMDADLQDPPEVIIPMVEKWREGYQVVHGLRMRRKGDGVMKLVLAKIFYRTIRKLSEVPLTVDVGEFRLIDRKVVDVLNCFKENSRYIRGLVSWVGFSQFNLPYERDKRFSGKTRYDMGRLLGLAIDGITSFSDKPLRAISYFGLITTMISLAFLIWIFVSKFIHPELSISGWASLIISVLFLGGIQLLSLGIIGQYIARIYRDVRQRPLYIINKKIGFGPGGKIC